MSRGYSNTILDRIEAEYITINFDAVGIIYQKSGVDEKKITGVESVYKNFFFRR